MEQRVDWCMDLLRRISAPITYNNVVGLDAWAITEGGWFGNPDAFNPLNTTQPEPGSRATNSAGVQTFPSYEEGMAATVTTLENGYYPNILVALRNDQGTEALRMAVQQSPWGTGLISIAAVQQAQQDVDSVWGTMTTPTGGVDMAQQDVDAINAHIDAVKAQLDSDIQATIKGYLTDFWNNQFAPALNALSAKVDGIANAESHEIAPPA